VKTTTPATVTRTSAALLLVKPLKRKEQPNRRVRSAECA
jgi:hypothetical protein